MKNILSLLVIMMLVLTSASYAGTGYGKAAKNKKAYYQSKNVSKNATTTPWKQHSKRK